MASFASSPIDRLCALLEQRVHNIDSNLSSKGEPPFDVFCNYAKDTSDKISGFTNQAPIRVKKIISSSFSKIGWDQARGRAVLNKITMSQLKECLRNIIAELNSYNIQPIEPSAQEISDIAKAAQRLWELDINRLTPGEGFILDVQGEKSPNDHRDMATRPLFQFVDPSYLEKPTFKSFLALLDNYIADEGSSEVVTKEETTEVEHFLDLIMDTSVMQYTHKWLARNNKVPSDRQGFIAKLNAAWFGLYRRKVANDSSGFEHVFLGEREVGKVVGLHNWLQLRNEEIAGRLNYKGKIRPRRRVPLDYPKDQLITIQFEWAGEEKFISSSFVGTSPEFEMALYSMCFFSGSEASIVALGPHRVNIKAFSIKQPGGPFIGSAFPEEADPDSADLDRAARVIQRPFIRKNRI